MTRPALPLAVWAGVLCGGSVVGSVATARVDLADEAARALSDLGAATAPALNVLRESADRLARLAESAGGVDDLSLIHI